MATRDPQRRRRLRRSGRGLVALTLLALAGMVVAFQAAVHWIAERELTGGGGILLSAVRLAVGLERIPDSKSKFGMRQG